MCRANAIMVRDCGIEGGFMREGADVGIGEGGRLMVEEYS